MPTEFKDLEGRVITHIEGLEKGSEVVKFITEDGLVCTMYHSQDCRESVTLEEIVGPVDALRGQKVLHAYETAHTHVAHWGSMTWTFYTIATVEGTVVLRWVGESNGYYSESVDITWRAA